MASPFNIPQRKMKAPNFRSGGSNQNMLMGYMLAQKKQQQQSQQIPGAIPTGGTDPVTGTKFETEEARFFTADAQNQLTRIKQLKNVAKGLESLALKLPTDAVKAGTSFGISELTGGRFGTEAVRTYSKATPAAAAGFYRAVTGDNRLSDADAASRATPLFWHPLEGEQTSEGKFSFINFMLDEAERNVSPNPPQDDTESNQRWVEFLNKSTQQFQTDGKDKVNKVERIKERFRKAKP